MNKACGTRLAWNLIQGAQGLWAEVLEKKYMFRNEEDLLAFERGDSALWRFISQQKDIVERGIRWNIRNGQMVSFFNDFWLFSDRKIRSMCLRSLTPEEEDSSVTDWVVAGSWDFDKLAGLVNGEVFQRLITSIPPREDAGSDVMIWGATTTGNFTVRSAYSLIEENPRDAYNQVFKQIWKWRGVERIRVFMWIAFHNRLPTNVWRSKWSTTSALCSECRSAVEDELHILRDCPFAEKLWKRLVHPRYILSFFAANLKDWFALNFKGELGFVKCNWSLIWGVTIWHLWNWRNKGIFESDFEKPADPWLFIMQKWRQFVNPNEELCYYLNGSNSEFFKWNPPQVGWHKMNVDGAVSDLHNRGGCGGVIRDHNGNWVMGFSHYIGICNVMEAEEWAIFKGLTVAAGLGLKRIIIESDAKLVIEMLHKENCGAGASLMYFKIKKLLQLEWEVLLQFVPREMNQLADGMAKEGLSRFENIISALNICVVC